MNLTTSSSTKKTSSTTGSATTDSPYLGSKISLVSKAKIRYEGILYTIDANESTVALSKVRSFGTEDRPTDRPVPARDEIFEYIIFRGADIEDLQVREPPQTSLTQDPAIVESSAYPDNARSTSIGTNTSLTGLAGQGSNRSLSNRGTMPSPPSHQGQGMKGYKSSDPLRQFNMNQQRSNRSYNHQSPMIPYEGNARRYRPSHQQDYYPVNRRSSAYQPEWNRPTQRYSRGLPSYETGRFYSTRRSQGGFQGQRQRRNSTGGMNTSSNRNAHRQQHQQQHQQQGERTRSNGTTSRSTLKFVGDFDFEKSNAEFDKNAIEDELKKSLSLKTTKKTDGETTSTDEQEKDKENQNEQEKQQQQQLEQLDQQHQHQQQTSHFDTFYDKQKSFFDCISCEANEKEKTTSRRNWNEERRVNAETFGLKYRPFQQNNNNNGGGNYRSSNRRNNNNNNGGRYQRANYSGRNAGYYGNFSNRVRVY